MKWIKISVIVILSVLVSVWFAAASRQVTVDGTEDFAFDSNGNLYLLSDEEVLTKVSPQGRQQWSVQLDRENEDGNALRYLDIIADNSGSIYLAVQAYERQVDAAGVVQDIALTEEIQTWNGEGVQQESVLQVDKSALSQFSTEPYIRKLQMQGEVLLALCCNQGQFDVIAVQPYGTQAPATLASYDLGEMAQELEDCAALSDGTLVYSTKGGSLMSRSPDGTYQDLSQLVGTGSLVGQVSADETDQIYYLDRRNGVLYALDLKGYTTERLYSPDTVVDAGTGMTFGQLQGARAMGEGSFQSVSIDSRAQRWVQFGGQTTVVDAVSQTWGALDLLKLAGVFLASVIVLSLVGWLLEGLFHRSRLTSKILLRFLPALVVVLAALTGAALWMLTAQQNTAQQTGLAAAAKTAAAQLDGVPLSLETLRQSSAAQRSTLQEQLDRAGGYAADVSGLGTVGLILYSAEGEDLYGVCTTQERDAFATADTLAPLSLELPSETVEAVQACGNEGGSVSFEQGGVAYVSYFQPVLDASGESTGMVEARMVRQSTLHTALGGSPAVYACVAVAAGVVVLLAVLLAVLMGAFLPLKELRRCIGEISAGRWNVQARITSGDELADIGMSFNQMTEKLNQYISNMVLLNNEYIKFTPRELFQLMGKTKVTDLSLRDKSTRDMSLLYVNFSLGGEKLNSEAYFALMNENFDKIFDVVDRNHGIIEHFDGSGMLALFPWQVRDALNTAIALKETMARENSAVELKMLISADETLVGVAGNQKRQTITAISGTIMDIYALTSLMDVIGTRYIITRRAVERIGDTFYFNCREIGSGDTGRESLYEFLDGMDPYEKKLHLVTRESFEQGVHDYQQGRYFTARKHFADVLQTNEHDTVAMYYLVLCDSHLQAEAALSR